VWTRVGLKVTDFVVVTGGDVGSASVATANARSACPPGYAAVANDSAAISSYAYWTGLAICVRQ